MNHSLAVTSSGRDNNFNLLRVVAASMVLVSHSYALSTGDRQTEPLHGWLGVTLGDVAVDVFFVVSGYLVAGSLLDRQSLVGFLAARALRIFPGLWLALAITVAGVGLCFTTDGLATFLGSADTWKHVLKNAVLFKGMHYELPGAFQDVPYRGAVNGSLWTLPNEVLMYLLLAAAWLLLGWVTRSPVAALRRFCAVVAVAGLLLDEALFLSERTCPLLGLLARFFGGAALRACGDRVPASSRLFVGLGTAVVVAAVAGPVAFGLTYRVALPYLVVYLALVPGGPLRVYNLVGDYSYGIYIYAFPVQQAIASLWPGITPVPMMAGAGAATLALAFLSWHLVEQRALRLKDCVQRGAGAREPAGRVPR